MSRSLRSFGAHRATLSAAKTLKCVVAAALTAALAAPLPAAAQHTRYKLIDTGTLGGPTSSLGFEGERDLNNQGTLVSAAETSVPDPYAPNCFLQECLLAHAVEWRNGVLTDLGALSGVNNSGAIWISDSGLIAGFSWNGIDPLTGFPAFQAVLFKNGSVIDLGTFGGNQSVASGVNERGQVVGCATTAAPDPYGFLCVGSAQQSRAFLWQDGVIRDLGTLGGPDALAELVNESGQVAGWSLTDSVPNAATGIPTQHPFLWENGTMRDLGTIGGTGGVQVYDLNSKGQIVGAMNVAGDQSFHPFLWDGQSLKDLGTLGGDSGGALWINNAGAVVGWTYIAGNGTQHAFLWRRGTMTDLGVLGGTACSVAYSVNSRTQIVGTSDDDCGGTNAHAFLWENGSLVDLNTLVTSNPSGAQLTVGLTINERGEIATQGVLPNGDTHAFLLVPSGNSQ